MTTQVVYSVYVEVYALSVTNDLLCLCIAVLNIKLAENIRSLAEADNLLETVYGKFIKSYK